MTTICDRCGKTFEVAPERCPTCLRKSSLRAVTAGDVGRLASGDQSQTASARRMSALLVAAALIVGLTILVLSGWTLLRASHLAMPSVVAALVAAVAFVHAALRTEGWAAFGARSLVGLGIALWALVSGVVGLVTTAGLSIALSLGVWAVTFFAGVIGYLQWLKSKDAPETPSGKHR